MATLKPKKTRIEDTVVGAYQKIEDKFVEKFLDVEEEIIEIPEEGDETDGRGYGTPGSSSEED